MIALRCLLYVVLHCGLHVCVGSARALKLLSACGAHFGFYEVSLKITKWFPVCDGSGYFWMVLDSMIFQVKAGPEVVCCQTPFVLKVVCCILYHIFPPFQLFLGCM